MTTLKVLHVMNSLQPSGMERMFVSAQPYWSDEGVVVRVLGQGAENPYAYELQRAGVDVVTVPRIGTARGAIQFARELRAWKPHVVHIHSERSYWVASLISALLGYRSQIRTIHSTFRPRRMKNVYRRLVARSTDHRMHAIVACSQDTAQNELRFGRDCEVVLNWVDDRFFDVQPGSEAPATARSRLLIVGNCSSIKRHWLVLEAALALEVEVIHFGDESGASARESELLDALDARGLLVGRGVDDPASAMLTAPTFVLPSTHEGMSVSLAEAIAADLPAIVADVPGIQWSRNFGGIRYVPEGADWSESIRDLTRETVGRVPGSRESLRARRGVDEYARLYRSAAAT